MPKKAHLIAGLLATLTIATFFLSTILVELFGSHEAVATVKSLIVTRLVHSRARYRGHRR
jgi:hypothetical protein